MPDAVEITGGDIKANILWDLKNNAELNEREARYCPPGRQYQYDDAAESSWLLHDKIEVLPPDYPKLEEMAAIFVRTEVRCCIEADERFFSGIGFRHDFQTADQLLDALLNEYRRVDRQETATH
jgi:hypothetical protein